MTGRKRARVDGECRTSGGHHRENRLCGVQGSMADREFLGPEFLGLDVECRTHPGYANKILDELNNLRRENQLCDVQVCVGDREFPCHRNVLRAASTYFKGMFSNNWRENRNEKVTLMDIEPLIFEQILDFMYSGSLSMPITFDNVSDLLITSEYLGLPYLEELCITYVTTGTNTPIDHVSLMELFSYALRAGKVNLLDHLSKCIAENFLHLFLTIPSKLIHIPGKGLRRVLAHLAVEPNDSQKKSMIVSFIAQWLTENQGKEELRGFFLSEYE